MLTAQAPYLHDTLAHGQQQGWSHMILDGKVVNTDRVAGANTGAPPSTPGTPARPATWRQHPGPDPPGMTARSVLAGAAR